MSFLDHAKDFQGVADVFLRDPDRYGPLLQFIENVMTRESELSKAEREMIASTVSRLNDCRFCLGAHRATLREMAVDEATIDAVEAGAETAPVSEQMKAVLRFARKVTLTPGEIGQTDIDRLRTAGWSDQAVEDVLNVISLFNYVNRLVDGFGIKGNDNYFRHVGRTLAREGYAPLIKTALKKAS